MRGKGLTTTTYLAIITLVFLLTSSLAEGRVFEFQKSKGIKVEVLSFYDFYIRFGDNPNIPGTNEEVIALAQRLFPPLEKKRLPEPEEKVFRCGTQELGLLFLALQNPDISDATRSAVDSIIADCISPLPKTFKSGHFQFFYDDTNPESLDYVTLEEIKVTARYMNSYWREYERNFKTPLHYVSGEEQLIDVHVCHFSENLRGATGPSVNFIILGSKFCVRDDCFRKTVPAHELFHRVQFSYGDVSGSVPWIEEGTATWAEKYTNKSIKTYMAFMNQGLTSPDKALIIDNTTSPPGPGRSYDASHFWVYLEEQAGGQGWTAIRDVWANYEAIKKNNPGMTEAEATRAAVNAVLPGAVGVDFDGFVQLWIKTNYIKDLANAGRTYDYDEDEVQRTNCGTTYGPLSQVKVEVINVPRTGWTGRGDVNAYGADYYEFNLGPTSKKLEIRCDGDEAGDFSYHFIGIKNNRWEAIIDATNTDYTYTKTFVPGEWDKVALVVGGREKGGNYEISVRLTDGTSTYPYTHYSWTFTPWSAYYEVVKWEMEWQDPPGTYDITLSNTGSVSWFYKPGVEEGFFGFPYGYHYFLFKNYYTTGAFYYVLR